MTAMYFMQTICELAHEEGHSVLVVGLNRDIGQDDLGPEK